MKYVMVVLVSCLPFSVAAVLARQPVSSPMPETAAERVVELRELRMERRELGRKILLLQAQGHNSLPR